ncbi:ABC1 kinase family protein [Streptomyces sp. NPDC057238]|uniref:ABC1 kinase family protein n=1 Tax=Streptomyces sp. NPDC057238 TaxID=3346060 RepID=UPI003627D8E9
MKPETDRLRAVGKVLGQLLAGELEGRLPGARRRASGQPAQTAVAGGQRGAGQEAQRRRVQAVRCALERLGPLYVKVGQVLSTRPDIVPAALRMELGNLHDQVAPLPFSVFEPVLERELGAHWRRMLPQVDTARPLGAASLAQVWQVTLPGGGAAVVKVIRPGARETVLADMRMLRRAARGLARAAPRFSEVINFDATFDVIFEAVEAELDLTKEARNMEQARGLVRHFDQLEVPEVFIATPDVLVQSLAPGVALHRLGTGSLCEEERERVGAQLLRFAYRGAFIDRFFHADPHPGNIYVTPGGGPVTLLDWGMVGRLDRGLSMRLVQVLMSMAHSDGNGLARAWTEMGYATSWANRAGFAADMTAMVPRAATATMREVNFGATLTDVLAKASKRGIASNPALSLLGKAFANLEGAVTLIAPELVVTDLFIGEVTGILRHLVAEATSTAQTGRTLVDLLIEAPASIRLLSNRVTDMASRTTSDN